MVAGLAGLFRRDHLIDKLYRVIDIKHGKRISAVCRYPPGLQCFQAHLKAGVILLLPFLWYPIYMVQTQDHGVCPLHIPVIAAHLLPLGHSQSLEPFGRCRFCLWNVIRIGTAEYLMGRKVDKTPVPRHGICRQNIGQCRHIAHGFCPSMIFPVKITVISPHKQYSVRPYTLHDVLDTLTVIGKIISLKYSFTGNALVLVPSLLSCQQVDPMITFIQFVDHRIHDLTGTANQ